MNQRSPKEFDSQVGARLRLARSALAMSQTELGAACGITFQQIQKYERGANRISASRLAQLAQKLNQPISYFFEGLDYEGTGTAALDSKAMDLILSDEGVDLIRAFLEVPAGPARRKVVNHIRDMALIANPKPGSSAH